MRARATTVGNESGRAPLNTFINICTASFRGEAEIRRELNWDSVKNDPARSRPRVSRLFSC